MTAENDTETSITQTAPKKEKNPKRVSAGKKGVEARKIKAEFKRKETELLKKENIELKQITSSEANEVTPEVVKDEKDYQLLLLYLSIGIGGLGLYFFSQRKHSERSEQVPIAKPETPTTKKEIDPFEF